MIIETIVDEVMPKVHPYWKHLLLQESLGKMTGIEVARKILKDQGRTDIKVCLRDDERNCYSPFLNLIGLSENVADSYSVAAVVIAAHEVSHALQLSVSEKLGRYLKSSSIFAWISSGGEMLLILPELLKLGLLLLDFAREQHSTQYNEINQSQKKT